MNESEVRQYITDTFEGVDVVSNMDTLFFFYNPPESDISPDHKFPFTTLVTTDIHDKFSNLDRPTVYRLNIGVSKQTFQSLFGSPKLPEYGAMEIDEKDGPYDFDFTALDQVMPHPVYGRQYWVCVLNPSKQTFETKVQPLLAEAYDTAVGKRDKQEARKK